jgi:hypothetical protein
MKDREPTVSLRGALIGRETFLCEDEGRRGNLINVEIATPSFASLQDGSQ